MTTTPQLDDVTRRLQIVPPAEHQATGLGVRLLNSATAGVVVSKVGQLRSEFRSQGRMFGREMCKHVIGRQEGRATAYLFEETFGYEDRLHFLIHMESLDTYYDMVLMGDQDAAYRESLAQQRVAEGDAGESGAWDRLFLDGEMTSTVLLPRPVAGGVDPAVHSASAGIVLHRSAQVGVGFRAEALEAAEELAEQVNADRAGQAAVQLFEEAFGDVGRLHWLVSLRDLTAYRSLLGAGQLDLACRPGVFVDGSVRDVALTPHHWGLYATRAEQPG
jgi:hypothetical protein